MQAGYQAAARQPGLGFLSTILRGKNAAAQFRPVMDWYGGDTLQIVLPQDEDRPQLPACDNLPLAVQAVKRQLAEHVAQLVSADVPASAIDEAIDGLEGTYAQTVLELALTTDQKRYSQLRYTLEVKVQSSVLAWIDAENIRQSRLNIKRSRRLSSEICLADIEALSQSARPQPRNSREFLRSSSKRAASAQTNP